MLNKTLLTSLILTYLFSAGISIRAEEPIPQTDEDKKVFRKFHPDGVVEFSDQPSRNSEELKMEELPTYKFAPAVPAPKLTPRPKQTQAKPGSTGLYTALTISSPARNETLRANNGEIDVKFTLLPGLQLYQGHQLEYLLDGKSVLKTERPQILKNVSRGTHTLIIQVIDKNNKVLIHSDSVSFHVKRFFKSRNKATPPEPEAPAFDAEYDT